MQVVGSLSRYINTVKKPKRSRKAARKDNGFIRSQAISDSRMLDDFELVDVFGVAIVILLVASVLVVIVTAPEVADTPEPPDSDWSFERVNETHAVIQHQGGEPVEIKNLTVIVEDYPRPAKWSGNTSDGYVREGSSATVEVADNQDVTLYWTGVDTVRRKVLLEGST